MNEKRTPDKISVWALKLADSPWSKAFARFTMGWWPVKLIVLLNIIVLLGYAMIGCVVAGQILSAVSPNRSMSIEVGKYLQGKHRIVKRS